ncbi:DUF6492 family protein [Microbacterium sp. KHB019]|uniref:DUF6492 family protein n=1 Tax=Microbacterium sp. KHB019 TaxID=3129770 RepID=UPI003078B380
MTLTVVTASYAPDFVTFRRLHESVVAHSADDVRHIVVVPDAHASLFRSLGSARLDVRPYSSVLPRRFLQTAWVQTLPGVPRGLRIAAVNVAHPWPPVRGWIMQQVIKLALVSELSDDVALLIDSDVVVVRTLTESAFRAADGTVRLYRRPHGITPAMTRHVAQRTRALELLGIDQVEDDSPDYISAFVSWDPTLVRALIGRISEVRGRGWLETVAACLDLSEYITYGTYVMSIAEPAHRAYVGEQSLCHSHWGQTPLTIETARPFVDAMRPDDLAVHVQSNSSTDEDVLRFIAEAAGR